MKYHLTLSIALAAVVASSCNHHTAGDKIKSNYWIHKTRIIEASVPAFDTTYVQGGIITNYTYDDKGKATATTSSDGSKTTFEHVGNLMIETKTDSMGKVISKQTEFLNDKWQTDSSITEENGKFTSAHKFIYDEHGNNIENRNYEIYRPFDMLRLAVIFKSNFQDSNVVNETTQIIPAVDTIVQVNPKTLKLDTIIQRISGMQLTYYNEYYTDKLNTSHSNSNSKNLLKTRYEVSVPGDTNAINKYRYTFDDKGRVLTEVFESMPGSGFRAGITTELEYDSVAHTYFP